MLDVLVVLGKENDTFFCLAAFIQTGVASRTRVWPGKKVSNLNVIQQCVVVNLPSFTKISKVAGTGRRKKHMQEQQDGWMEFRGKWALS